MKLGCQTYTREVSFQLPPSKSILARVILLRLVEEVAYGRDFALDDVKVTDPSDDVSVMLRFAEYFHSDIKPNIATSNLLTFHCGESGTALRFITAFCAALPIRIRLTAQGRLGDRPMQELLQVLKMWGAYFEFEEDHPFATPIIIYGKKLLSRDIFGSEKWRSSQFVSALILISPLIASNFWIHRSKNAPSSHYIILTISVMNSFGYDVVWDSNRIKIVKSNILPKSKNTNIESDWSSASYWYELMLLHPEIEYCHLPDLNFDSAQPDRRIADAFEILGVDTLPAADGISLRRDDFKPSIFLFNCAQSPDIFPALFCALVGAGVSFRITGVSLLRYKESDRIQAMVNGAQKLGYSGFSVTEDTISWEASPRDDVHEAIIDGYGDHRVVMAFAVLATSLSDINVEIQGEHAVAKSYPSFFSELMK